PRPPHLAGWALAIDLFHRCPLCRSVEGLGPRRVPSTHHPAAPTALSILPGRSSIIAAAGGWGDLPCRWSADDGVGMSEGAVLATFFGDEEFPVEWEDGQRELFWVHDDLH